MKKLRIERTILRYWKRSYEVDIPRTWRELQRHQYAAASRIYSGQTSEDEFLMEYYRMSRSTVALLDDYQRYKLFELSEFVRKPSARISFFYIKNIRKYSAPMDQLANVDFERFMIIDTFFGDYLEEPTAERLARFVAVLYLAKGESLQNMDLAAKAKRIERKIDERVQHSAVLNWILVKNWLGASFGSLFEESAPAPKKGRAATKAVAKRTNWIDIFREFVGEAVHHQDTYKRMHCLEALGYLNQRIRKSRTK